jgi:hypothetical protein
MTTEERFERIEHVTAELFEQFRMEREENRQLWRNSQRQIDALGEKIEALGRRSTAWPRNPAPRISGWGSGLMRWASASMHSACGSAAGAGIG